MSKKKWSNRALSQEIKEIDYWDKLSPEDREYLTQFLYEFYQADFNHDTPIHDTDRLVKDCQDRNNGIKRQIFSVGSEKVLEAADRARKALKHPHLRRKYYTPEDYPHIKEGVRDEDDEENT